MRLSGVLLLGLATLQVVDRHLAGDIEAVTALSMAVRWRSGLWQLADFAFVVLASLHALVGLHWAAVRRMTPGTLRLSVEAGGAIVIGAVGLSAAWTVLTYGP
jgi:succinate dehydrogenase hydrophobic anchor subunit